MTTAFAYTVRGEFLAAFNAHPAGLALAVMAVLSCGLSLSVVLSGRVWVVNWRRVRPKWVTLAAVLLFLGGWMYKIVVGVLSGALPIRG
jgi:hypothetical protein